MTSGPRCPALIIRAGVTSTINANIALSSVHNTEEIHKIYLDYSLSDEMFSVKHYKASTISVYVYTVISVPD